MRSFALLTSGCRSVSSEVLEPTLRSAHFCTERHVKHPRQLDLQVAESMRAAGLDAAAAESGRCREAPAYRVTYLDNWSWDMRLYLAKMTIEVLDRRDRILAYGEAAQDSLGALGTSHRDVIDRAVGALLEGSE